MNLTTVILIAFGLTFDTFAVSVTSGLLKERIKFYQAVKIALIFAILQGIMPVIGWFAGEIFSNKLVQYNRIIGFAVLLFLGLKMIIEAVSEKEDDKKIDPLNPKVAVALGLATSIDALVAGFGFAFFEINIFHAAVIIAFATFIVAMTGMLVGKKGGQLIGKKAEISGGIILILIGLKILLNI